MTLAQLDTLLFFVGYCPPGLTLQKLHNARRTCESPGWEAFDELLPESLEKRDG